MHNGQVTMWVQLKRWCVWVLQRGHNGDGCDLALTLCNCQYDLGKGDLFVLSWARVRRVMQGSISSELLMCGGGVRSILLLPLVARCLEKIDVCIWHIFVFMSVVVTDCGNVCWKWSFSLGVLKYVVCLCSGWVVHCCVFWGPDC